MAPTAVAQADLTQVPQRPIQGRPDDGFVPPPRSQSTVQQGALVGEPSAQDSGQQADAPANPGIGNQIDSLNAQLGPLQAQYEQVKRQDPDGAETLRLERKIKDLQDEINRLIDEAQAGARQNQRPGGQSATPSVEQAREANRPGQESVGATPESMRQAIRERRSQEPTGATAESAKRSIQDWKAGNLPKERAVRPPVQTVKRPTTAAEGVHDSTAAAQARLQSKRANSRSQRKKDTSGEVQAQGINRDIKK